MEHENMLKDRFDLDISLLRANRRKDAAVDALRQAKFDLREAQQAQTLYGSTIKSMLDKLTGKREAQKTELRHRVLLAEAALATAKRAVSDAEAEILRLTQALASLPEWESLKTAENEAIWCPLEALYCAEVLLPLLQICHDLLMERRNQINGSNAGQIQSHYEVAEIHTAPEQAGESCRIYIQRMQAALEPLGMQLPAYTYFDDPSYFLNSATRYTRFDKLNQAIAQTEALLREIPALQKKLSP